MKIKNPLIVPAVLVAVAITVASLVTSCSGFSKYTEQYQDAPRSGQEDMSGAQIIGMPDGFSNLATKCVNGIRYTVIFHNDNTYGAVSTVVDPECKK